jgi:hypothetical protein
MFTFRFGGNAFQLKSPAWISKVASGITRPAPGGRRRDLEGDFYLDTPKMRVLV